MSTSEEIVKVPFKKESLKRENLEQRTAEVEVPELNKIMGLGSTEVAVVKVRQLTLDEVIKFKTETLSHIKNLLDGIVEASVDASSVASEMKDALKRMSPETEIRIDTVSVALIDPKLLRSDIVFLSNMFPLVISRIYNKIVEITNSGADIKKNSS